VISLADPITAKPRRPPLARALRYVLTHPLTIRAKQPLRDVIWSFKGAGIENPPLPQRVESMLFVCLGNICRSPFGALMAERLLAEAARAGIRCTSAGIRPSRDARSPVDACEAAADYGVRLDNHVPRLLTRELVAAHDLVVVMEASQLDQLRLEYPEFRDRIILLSLYDDDPRGPYERYNIDDPYGQPRAAFVRCYRRVTRSLRRLLAAVPPLSRA
jgi:protein-tyrosine-phosphatase